MCSRYIEATGLMWELAPKFGALLVFIEHRYAFPLALSLGLDDLDTTANPNRSDLNSVSIWIISLPNKPSPTMLNSSLSFRRLWAKAIFL